MTFRAFKVQPVYGSCLGPLEAQEQNTNLFKSLYLKLKQFPYRDD